MRPPIGGGEPPVTVAKTMAKEPTKMTLAELAQEMRKEPETLDYRAAHAEMDRRRTLYMMASAIATAVAAIAAAVAAFMATLYTLQGSGSDDD